ncbi:protein-glutamate methylesterase/protein-glutamine glutaminase [Vibrio nomapromontoriensis]|uniref:protein-glutamate methylesterase/protein-glutamine glutaminase n=1 Tax=Vibrio nomapromontoriensis TaxID=2910246 RepID=UPI003D146BAF
MPLKIIITDSCHETCEVLNKIISSQANMTVAAIAHDAKQARALIKRIDPDVITLAIELDGMSGLAFLDKIMTLRPMPVVIISKLIDSQPLIAQQALKLGAMSCIAKPSKQQSQKTNLDSFTLSVIKQIKQAAAQFERCELVSSPPAVNTTKVNTTLMPPPNTTSNANHVNSKPPIGDVTNHLIAIGASTGGTEAITEILKGLPPNCPGIVIAQHMPAGFTRSFAARLQGLCSIKVQEAQHDQVIRSGHAYIAPGNKHLLVQKRAGVYYTILSDGSPVNLHKPSIDVLFASIAENVKALSVGVILTGMGKDGAAGLLKMKETGAKTFAQDEKSSIVYGMPREAKKLGAVSRELPIDQIANAILTVTNPTSPPPK